MYILKNCMLLVFTVGFTVVFIITIIGRRYCCDRYRYCYACYCLEE